MSIMCNWTLPIKAMSVAVLENQKNYGEITQYQKEISHQRLIALHAKLMAEVGGSLPI